MLRKQLFGDLRMAKLLKTYDEDVLSRTTSVKEPQTATLPPFLKPKIVELPHVVGDDKWSNAILETLLKENQAPDAPITVLKRMYLFESHMQVEQILE